jgi:hypothetical protein
MALNREKFIELLRGKIDSWQKWSDVIEQVGLGVMWNYPTRYWGHPGIVSYMCHHDMQVGSWDSIPIDQRWWVERETARKYLGVYPEPTEVMRVVSDTFCLGAHFIHISRDDPSMVAYTPSMEYGLADRQVKMSFGKLLRKMLLLATDTHIQRLEASHRSEMDPTFLVARTTDEIEHVYRNMAGDGGCMRHDADYFGIPENTHPSHVYSYAGVAVAYTEVDGRIISRSVIYDNPDDPKDKRYVRIYGDGALKRKLELAGYKLGSLLGAKLRAMHLPTLNPEGNWSRDKFIVPYLDGPGGNQDHQDASVYHIQGEDCIRVINSTQASRLHAMGFTAPRCKNTGVIHRISSIPPERLQFTCAVTGQAFNLLEVTPAYALVDGEVKQTVRENLPDTMQHHAAYHWDANDARVAVYMTREDYNIRTFYAGGIRLLDTPENRRRSGFVLLDAATYGEGVWELAAQCVSDEASEPTWWRKADCMLVFDAQGKEQYMTQVKADALRTGRKKQYVSVAPHGSTRALSHVDNPRLVMTLGKRRCVKDWHSVVQLFDGSWDYRQNCCEFALMGRGFWCSDKQPVVNVRERRVPEESWSRVMAAYLADYGYEGNSIEEKRAGVADMLVTWLRRGVDGFHYFKRGDMLFRGHRYENQGTVAQMREALAKLAEMSDEQITEMLDASHVSYARCWQYHAEIICRLADAWLAQEEAAHAGQQALAERALDDLDSQLEVTATHIRDERAGIAGAVERFAAAA